MAIPHTVILGTGIIGVSTAHYLSQSQPPSSIHLVDPSNELFSSASGHAGGFLAKDWFNTSLASLGALSYNEHEKLAKENGGAEKWCYSRTVSTSLKKVNAIDGERSDDWIRGCGSRADAAKGSGKAAAQAAGDRAGAADKEQSPKERRRGEEEARKMPWLRRDEGDEVELVSDSGCEAQIDPKLFCQFLLQQCIERGVQVHHPAEAGSVSKDLRDSLASIRIVDQNGQHEVDIPCTRLILTAGLWTPSVFSKLFPNSSLQLPISNIAGHSIVVRSPRWKGVKETETSDGGIPTCHAIFTSKSEEGGFAPELFTRPNGDIWLGGLNTPAEDQMSEHPPSAYSPSKPKADHVEKLTNVAKQLLGDDIEVVKSAVCYRPIVEGKDVPIIQRIEDEDLGGVKTLKNWEGGVYVVCGHGPWGISLSLGTGKVVSEMVRGVTPSVDVNKFTMMKGR